MGIQTFVAAVAVAFAVQTGQGQTSNGQTVSEPGHGVTNPILVRKVDPVSTDQAKAQKITGEVWLDAVVNADGTVDVRKVQKAPDGAAAAGLEQAAIDAAKQWLFKPGMKESTAVPVHVVLIMEFKGPAQAAGGVVYPPGAPIKNPVVKSKIDPKYTEQAMRAKLQGEVWLDVIVETDGSVTVLGVKKSLDKDYGLDDAAIDAAKKWSFEPGTKDGTPVRVRITLIMQFKLHPPSPTAH